MSLSSPTPVREHGRFAAELLSGGSAAAQARGQTILHTGQLHH